MRSASVLMVLLWIAATAYAESWQPVGGRLMTPWAKEVTPENALPEYPRPQMVRKQWTNLNGLWDYAVTARDAAVPASFEGKILVPFCIESSLSGVGKPLMPDQQLIYRTRFVRPGNIAGKRLLLHFGAVDWQATVFVNGRVIGTHQGGYDPFSFDITEALTSSGLQELIVKVIDPSDTSFQLFGKQSLKPSNECYYTTVSGIWQTVWLEAVRESSIANLLATAKSSLDGFVVTVAVRGGKSDDRVTVRLRDGDVIVAEATAAAGQQLQLAVPSPKRWSPASPFLYDLEATLASGDSVHGYAALRSIAVKQDEQGCQRLALNGTIGFQFGPLDQGFWPDGIYTAPTDDALRSDIEAVKRMGFNVVRKHIKVEPARWYYWCDKLGLMVWQDIPSAKAMKGDEGRVNFSRETKAIVEALRPFPSIIMWVLFNEGWGQGGYGIKESGDLGRWLENYDPSRLVNVASGWTDVGSGHLRDMHIYPVPDMPPTDGVRASVVGEFGGLKAFVPEHTWTMSAKAKPPFDNRELRTRYQQLFPTLRLCQGQGLAGAIYTQLTDVENELNGLITYDRRINKLSEDWLKSLHQGLDVPSPAVTTLAGGTIPWSFATSKPADGWLQPQFDDTQWEQARGPLGANFRGAQTLSPWTTPAIWLRKPFTLPKKAGTMQLVVRPVRGAQLRVSLNGVVLKEGKSEGLEIVPIDGRSIQPGRNVVTVEATREAGASRASFDVRLLFVPNDSTTPSPK